MNEIDVARGRQEAFTHQHPALLETLREIAVVQSVESSNAIERVTAPRARIEALVAKKATPRNRPEAEIAGYRDVLGTIHSSALQIPFEPSVVLQLHRDLYAFTGVPRGRWKGSDNLVVEERADGTTVVRFRPVGWFETPAAMDELHDRFNRAWEEHRHHRLLLAGAYALDFLVIHPFLDGNGWISRLLTLLLLYKAGYEIGRFISLEKLIEDTKESYYDALAASTAGWQEDAH